MKLWRISQKENNNYDTYSAAVVAALDEETARKMHPYEGEIWNSNSLARRSYGWWYWGDGNEAYPHKDWASHPFKVKVEYVGEAAPGVTQGVICHSFHAG